MDTYDFEKLFHTYQKSKSVCDPVDFQIRQRNLLYELTEYVLHKDMPQGFGEVEDEEPPQDR